MLKKILAEIPDEIKNQFRHISFEQNSNLKSGSVGFGGFDFNKDVFVQIEVIIDEDLPIIIAVFKRIPGNIGFYPNGDPKKNPQFPLESTCKIVNGNLEILKREDCPDRKFLGHRKEEQKIHKLIEDDSNLINWEEEFKKKYGSSNKKRFDLSAYRFNR